MRFFHHDTRTTERVKRDIQTMLGDPPIEHAEEFLDELVRRGYVLTPPYLPQRDN